MKCLLKIILFNVMFPSDLMFANPNIKDFQMSKIELNNYIESGLHRILIIPQIHKYKKENVLMGTGIGVIEGDDISKFETELSSIVAVEEPMSDSEYYLIYIFNVNKIFDESKHILMCEIAGNKVNLIVSHDNKFLYLSLSDDVSKIITKNITKKLFSLPSTE